MKKEEIKNYFVREDLVSEQHIHHCDEFISKKADKFIFAGTILDVEKSTTPKSEKNDFQWSENFLG